MFGVSGQYYGLSYGCNFSNPACSGFVVRRLYYKTNGVVEGIGYNLKANSTIFYCGNLRFFFWFDKVRCKQCLYFKTKHHYSNVLRFNAIILNFL